jgi:hypothetical protein
LAHISSRYCNNDSLFHRFPLSSKAHAREEHAHNLENELWSSYQFNFKYQEGENMEMLGDGAVFPYVC